MPSVSLIYLAVSNSYSPSRVFDTPTTESFIFFFVLAAIFYCIFLRSRRNPFLIFVECIKENKYRITFYTPLDILFWKRMNFVVVVSCLLPEGLWRLGIHRTGDCCVLTDDGGSSSKRKTKLVTIFMFLYKQMSRFLFSPLIVYEFCQRQTNRSWVTYQCRPPLSSLKRYRWTERIPCAFLLNFDFISGRIYI